MLGPQTSPCQTRFFRFFRFFLWIPRAGTGKCFFQKMSEATEKTEKTYVSDRMLGPQTSPCQTRFFRFFRFFLVFSVFGFVFLLFWVCFVFFAWCILVDWSDAEWWKSREVSPDMFVCRWLDVFVQTSTFALQIDSDDVFACFCR